MNKPNDEAVVSEHEEVSTVTAPQETLVLSDLALGKSVLMPVPL